MGGRAFGIALVAGEAKAAASTVRWCMRESSQICLTFPVTSSERWLTLKQ